MFVGVLVCGAMCCFLYWFVGCWIVLFVCLFGLLHSLVLIYITFIYILQKKIAIITTT